MNYLCLLLLGNYYNTFSNRSSFYAVSPSYLKQLYCIPFSSIRFFNSSHWIHFCSPMITYIIILYKQKIIQSKYKVKVPLLTLIFKSSLYIVLYLSRRYFNISSLFCSYRSLLYTLSFQVCSAVPSTINEESIIASNLANRGLRSFILFF